MKWDAAMVVEHGCEQLRCSVGRHPESVARAGIIPSSDYALGLFPPAAMMYAPKDKAEALSAPLENGPRLNNDQ